MIDFIGIGTQKSGTTWLYKRLNELPEYALTPQKELHYFDRDEKYPSPNVLTETYLKKRILSIKWLYRAIGKPIQQILFGRFNRFPWYINYFYSNYDDKWYLSLFQSLEGIKGEITPSYSILKQEDIVRMNSLAPNAKLILLLRNPIERAWSHFRHVNKYNRKFNLDNITNEDLKIFLNSEPQELRSNYLLTIKNYKKIFKEGQIIVGFYDAIVDKPEELLKEIVVFTGGNVKDISKYCKLNKIDNPSVKAKIPKEIHDYLKEKYKPLISELAYEYGGYFKLWYQENYQNTETSISQKELNPTFII